jgi:ketosteroid isomerase-like protein
MAVALIAAPAFFDSAAATAVPQTATVEALAELREAWVQDLRTKQLEPILKFYAADAAFLQPDGERISGSAAIRTVFQTIMATFNSDLTLQSQNLESSGILAYDSGRFQETLTNIATGAKINSKASYVIIYKRQSNGPWQIVQHSWTGTPPPGTWTAYLPFSRNSQIPPGKRDTVTPLRLLRHEALMTSITRVTGDGHIVALWLAQQSH